MKKMFLSFTALLISLVLTACGSNEAVTVEEIMNQSIAATKEIKSYSVEIETSQSVNSGSEEMLMASTGTIDATVDPLAIYQKMNISMNNEIMSGKEGMLDGIQMEMYFTEDGIFMENPMISGWMSLPAESYNEVLALSAISKDPTVEIERLINFIDEFTFSEDSESYYLSLSLSGKSLNDFLYESISQLAPDLNQMMTENSTFNMVDYSYVINKQTFYPEKIKMLVDMEIEVEPQKTIHIIQELTGTYSNFNSIDSIVIPDEVLENAIGFPKLTQ